MFEDDETQSQDLDIDLDMPDDDESDLTECLAYIEVESPNSAIGEQVLSPVVF